MLKVRKGSSEEIPLIQDKEQWLCFAGAAEKRYQSPKSGVAAVSRHPTSKVRYSGCALLEQP